MDYRFRRFDCEATSIASSPISSFSKDWALDDIG
jgi:hypothetical protein